MRKKIKRKQSLLFTILIAGINENSPGSKCEQDSNVLGASRGTEKDLISFSRNRQRERIYSRENVEQKRYEGETRVFSQVGGVYGKRRYLGRVGKLGQYNGLDRKI